MNFPLNSIHFLNKGLGEIETELTPENVAAKKWNLLREDISLPAAVLYQEKIQHNLEWMQQFINNYNVKLCPHGKTTMAPRLFQMQLDGGAWGITLANAHQTHVAYAHGVRRVLMANQLIGKRNIAIISKLLADPTFEFFCLVDSPAIVDTLGAAFSATKQKLNVLLELGENGGRTGVRTAEQLYATLAAIEKWHGTIVLSGIELYEGVLQTEGEIRNFLQRAVATLTALDAQKKFARTPVILSGAGSAWYDVVAEEFSKAKISSPLDIVLRPGCYLTHDTGVYLKAQQRIDSVNPVARKMHTSLQPALHLWAYVQSIPEPGKAILGLGKRDAAFDNGLPSPAFHYRPGAEKPSTANKSWEVTKLMDQHAYMQITPGDDLRVGDLIGLDISHPCLTFDKWRWLLVVDPDFNIIDAVQTFF